MIEAIRPCGLRCVHARIVMRAVLLLVALAGVWRGPVQAQAEVPPVASVYVVQPGDTLASIAARFGFDVVAVQRLNALQDPRRLYVGQTLWLPAHPGAEVAAWSAHSVALGDDAGLLAQRAGVAWETLAAANRMLNPASMLVGQRVVLPDLVSTRVMTSTTAEDSLLQLALRHDVAYWDALRLNSHPLHAGALFLAPGAVPVSRLPYPILALRLTPQPVARGQTAVIVVETAEPASCTVRYLDVTEPCYGQSDTQLYALLGFPALLEPGVRDVVVRVETSVGESIFVLPVYVTAGRYDYERIDLPPDRQSLLDPALSQQESAKIAVLRTLRTPERLWEFPFHYPLEASVTSYFGSRRSYGYGFGSYHGGTDFQAERGAPVLAPASGVVVLAETLVVRGNAILIDHGWGVVSGYWHLSRIDVTVGQRVAQGERIGAVGNTGLSTGPHLHWELWVNGVSVSPLQWVDIFAADLAPGR